MYESVQKTKDGFEVMEHEFLFGIFCPEKQDYLLVLEQRKTVEGDFRFWPREKWNESQKMKEGGGGGEGRKRLQTNPSILKTCVRQRTQRLISLRSKRFRRAV